MNSKIEAKVTHRFKASAEQVYDAWLNPAQVRLWMTAALRSFGLAGDIQRIEIDARKGGKFFFSDLRDGTEARHWGTYIELERPRKIVFTWIIDESAEADPSVVTLTIEPEANGCIATIVHTMDAQWIEFISQTEKGWSGMLREIEKLLE